VGNLEALIKFEQDSVAHPTLVPDRVKR
jgi:hypothetical protein